MTAGASLYVGSAAPLLHTGKWMQGEPISRFVEGTAYLIEFWASWSAPSRESIPQMNEIHQKFKYKGMMVLGQNCWEQDESAATDFVKQTKLAYPVALDDQDRSMAKDWMSAAGRSSLPAAFVVDKKGIVALAKEAMELVDEAAEAPPGPQR